MAGSPICSWRLLRRAPRSSCGRLVAATRRVALVVAAAVFACSCHPAQTKSVVLVTIDTLRADHVGLYGYGRATTPNIDRWFAKGRLYTHCWSAEASTTPSVVSLLTGLLPQQHGVRQLIQLLPQGQKILPELMPPAWQSAGFVSNMMLTTETSGIGSRFGYYDDFVDEKEKYRGNTYERDAARTTDAVLAWLDKPRDPSRPLLLWVHYMDPHGPYHPPDDWPRRFHHDSPLPIDVSRILPYEREPDVDDGLAYVDAYDEEIAYVDSQVGRLLEGVDQRLGGDSTLTILTADHGESLMDHEDWFRHAVQVYDTMTRVPLMLRGPGVQSGRSDLPTSGLDVAPTILAAAGAPPLPSTPDVDLRSGRGLDASRIIYTEASFPARDGGDQWRAAIQNNRKWAIGVRPGDCRAELRRYDLAADPDELTIKVWNEDGEAPRSLLRLCQQDPDPAGVPKTWAFGATLKGPKTATNADAEKLSGLKALGYAD